MNNMNINKKFLQLIASVWIVLFHMCMPVTGTQLEQFFLRIGYVGVDLFFFLSAYSLAGRLDNYASLLINRLVKIYLKFVLFALAAVFIKGWSLLRFIKIISGVELFQRGGGAFLWFLPAIMIFYIIFPFFVKWKWRYKSIAVILIWFIVSLFFDKVLGYTSCFIFTNRIPVMLVGYWAAKYPVKRGYTLPAIPIGVAALYIWGYKPRLDVPIKDFFYIIAIILVVGLVGLSAYIGKNRVIDILASATIEMYGLQMIAGTDIVNFIYSYVNNKIMTNILSIILVICFSIIISEIYDLVCNRIVLIFKLKQQS